MLIISCCFLLLFSSGGAEAGQPVHDLIMLEHEKQKTLTIQKSLVNLTQGYLNPLYIELYFDYVDQVNFSPQHGNHHHAHRVCWSPSIERKARYVELLRSVVDVRGMKIALYPSGCTTVNILYETNRENSVILPFCCYFNAYSYLAKVWCRCEHIRQETRSSRAARTITLKSSRTSPARYKVPRFIKNTYRLSWQILDFHSDLPAKQNRNLWIYVIIETQLTQNNRFKNTNRFVFPFSKTSTFQKLGLSQPTFKRKVYVRLKFEFQMCHHTQY